MPILFVLGLSLGFRKTEDGDEDEEKQQEEIKATVPIIVTSSAFRFRQIPETMYETLSP